jgi:Uma2 family endonuclease
MCYARAVAATPLRRPATYDDLLQVPDNLVAEIVDGELYTSPRPGGPHAVAASTLGIDIGGAYHLGRGGPGGWWILDEPELHLGDDVLVPDLAGWRRERMPEPPASPAFTIVPDWVCEVISPGTERLDRARKLPIYAHAGVGHAWLVSPLARTLEVLRLHEGCWLLIGAHSSDEVVRAEPFEAVELDLLLLWGETRTPREG